MELLRSRSKDECFGLWCSASSSPGCSDGIVDSHREGSLILTAILRAQFYGYVLGVWCILDACERGGAGYADDQR